MTWHPDPVTGEPIMHLGKGYGDIYVSDLGDEWWSDEDEDEQRDDGSHRSPEEGKGG